ncbi:HalOD1 output domain-containing protein [Haladaptatus sp. DYF46]|uniref:HalOD1 output domain-containing protein n=1 Tax=Haladaptatus sp. DYF46 TaxID=2886041 RepID=UPI001E598D8D|nr:HalOD1 output domain-containing protein [Haladaptatus sp. DYF46]
MKENRFTERATDLDRDGRKAYRVAGENDDPSTRVIRGVEEIVGQGAEKQTWLYDSVDPDALDAIFGQKHDGTLRTNGKITFLARGCEILINADGEIVVYGPVDEDETE